MEIALDTALQEAAAFPRHRATVPGSTARGRQHTALVDQHQNILTSRGAGRGQGSTCVMYASPMPLLAPVTTHVSPGCAMTVC